MEAKQAEAKAPASTARLKELMAGYYHRLQQAATDPGQKVAWCSSIGPAELLLALGFKVYFPENHGAALGASRMAGQTIPLAVAAGYSPEICSYLTSDIGAHLAGITPLTASHGLAEIPRPDVLVFNNNQCREVQDWFMYYARLWGVPMLGVNSPRVLGQVKPSHVADVVSQLQELAGALEDIAGQRLDPARLERAVGLSRRCTDLWQRVLELSARRPAPLSFFDHCIHMAPAVVLRGAPEAVEYYEALLGELEQDPARAAVPGERWRLYWDGMPVWGRLRMLSDTLGGLGAAVVASTYCNSWLFPALDPRDPWDSMARASLECFNVRDEEFKQAYLLRWARLCGVQGIIFHDARTCPYNTNSRFGLPRRLREGQGIPSLVLDGDLNDLRCFSDEQARTNLEAFVEQLAQA
ncbi:MAG: 2-hydroxyacyl-CoA dehydratase family protein [Proteobacteria bacterium]|nr:2-hydroxyacyl-CoA dehydratase family protein [Pseudomonadota bacterium]MBU1450944.1 2-hydroxyacyl-CoA dehydratase family protein [Pseudomonadota bacterium]MBU2469372.1 2-hydroxyacyl-CoA dehydratase family protein [Pseudomonadota bacterium]MBU2518381.1 2-hydroxyacyl-CoA dehydratase family protein [Pseudomonadota bacterium]